MNLCLGDASHLPPPTDYGGARKKHCEDFPIVSESKNRMSRSIIYRHVWLYRLVMALLYKGRYRARFQQVCGLIRPSDRTVLELCFGDVFLAEHCRRTGAAWIGLDSSAEFVANAVRLGYDARRADLLNADVLPACDLCVIMGSLYHFFPRLDIFFERMKRASRRLVISEPVLNWTNAGGVLRTLARALTRTDAQEETFRFTEASLRQTLDGLGEQVGFTYRVVSVERDMVVEVVWSR